MNAHHYFLYKFKALAFRWQSLHFAIVCRRLVHDCHIAHSVRRNRLYFCLSNGPALPGCCLTSSRKHQAVRNSICLQQIASHSMAQRDPECSASPDTSWRLANGIPLSSLNPVQPANRSIVGVRLSETPSMQIVDFFICHSKEQSFFENAYLCRRVKR